MRDDSPRSRFVLARNFMARLNCKPYGSGALVFALVLLAAPAARAKTVTFCVDRANPLFQLDESVAAAAAASQGATSAFVVRDSSKADNDDDSGNEQAKFFVKMAKTCDLIMGFPVEAGYPALPDGMAATRPYARTGFVAAATGRIAGNFSAMAADGKIGVVFLTPASTYFTAQNVAAERVYYSNDELFGALLAGQVNDVLIWQPWLVRELAEHKQTVQTAFLAMPHTQWNIEALYPQTTGQAAANLFNNGVRMLRRGGKLAALISPYKTP
jgi:hypothetical protein